MGNPSMTYGFPCPACEEDDAFAVFAVHHDYEEWAKGQKVIVEERPIPNCPLVARIKRGVCEHCGHVASEAQEDAWFTHARENCAQDEYESGLEAKWEAYYG
jgi:hypothetical protein